MTTTKTRYQVSLYIDGEQVGTDSQFAEWCVDDADAEKVIRVTMSDLTVESIVFTAEAGGRRAVVRCVTGGL
jgi:hypothetical protein